MRLSAVTGSLLLLLAGAALSLPGRAQAADLVHGPGSMTAARVAPSMLQEGEAGGLSLQFTPRNPLLLLLGETPEPAREPAELEVRLGQGSDLAGRLGIVEGNVGYEDGASSGGLELGGALRWSDWMVGSGYTRARMFGGDADLVSASIGYGRFTTRFSYGESDRPQSTPLDVMMLSTDLAARSWLRLQGDVALGSDPDGQTDSVAAGRLGIHLSF